MGEVGGLYNLHIYLCFFLFWIGCWIIGLHLVCLVSRFQDIREEFLGVLITLGALEVM